jgi:hypothetical protein
MMQSNVRRRLVPEDVCHLRTRGGPRRFGGVGMKKRDEGDQGIAGGQDNLIVSVGDTISRGREIIKMAELPKNQSKAKIQS